jgi:hypothetical protein
MYNIYIICKNNDIFIKKTEMFKGYSTINSIHWIPSEFLKVTDNNKTKLLSILNTRYNTSEKNRISKLGCIAAHRKALLSIINNQTTNNIILEEDATLLNSLPNTPPNVSCYLGGWIIPPHISKANKVKIELPKLFNNDINSIDYSKFKILMAHSYFIKSVEEVENILLSTIGNKIKNYDVHLTDNKFITYFYFPSIFVQNKHISSIDNTINKNHIYTLNYGL